MNRIRLYSVLMIIAMLLNLSAPVTGLAEAYSAPARQQTDFLEEVARSTWAYLGSDWATHNHLPASYRKEGVGKEEGDYANPAEIGLYALSWLAAYDMGRSWSPTWAQAEAEVTAVLNQLRAWQTGSQTYAPHGPNAYQNSVFYQWYWIGWTPPVVGEDVPRSHNQLVPSIDNAWLAACLMAIQTYAQANNHPAMAQKAYAILHDMNFMLWYHPDRHLFTWGAEHDPQDEQNHWFADTYSDENRIINFVARALGQMSAEEYRLSLQAMDQTTGWYRGIRVEKIGWDGSYFTYTAPALFIREMQTVYGWTTIEPATRAQIQYAQDQGYTAWGFSDCFDIDDTGFTSGYMQAGAPPARIDPNPPLSQFGPSPTESHPGLVSPFAAALALNTPLASQAEVMLNDFADKFPCLYHDAYGFNDSVMARLNDPQYGKCSARFSALAQEWTFLSLANYLNQHQFIWKYFYKHPGVISTQQEMVCAVGQCLEVPVVFR